MSILLALICDFRTIENAKSCRTGMLEYLNG